MDAKKERALAALLTNPTRAAAAKQAGVTVRTLNNYFTDPEFCKRYSDAFLDIVQDATRQSQQLLAPAFTTLQEIIVDKDQNAQVRVTAIRTLLDFALRFTDHVDIAPRLEELERIAEEVKKNGRN